MRVELGSRWWPAAGLLASAIVLTWIAINGPEGADFLSSEAGAIQWITAVAFLSGAVFAAVAALRSQGWRRAFFAVWAVLCFVFFGEETSWLQHLIGYDTPEAVRPLNMQGEFNLHNLWLFQADEKSFFATNLSNLLSPVAWLKSHPFLLGFAVFFLAYPAVARVWPLTGFVRARGLPYPGSRLLMAVWLPLLATAVFTFLGPDWARKAVAEAREMFCALAIAGFLGLALLAATSRALAPAAGLGETSPSI